MSTLSPERHATGDTNSEYAPLMQSEETAAAAEQREDGDDSDEGGEGNVLFSAGRLQRKHVVDAQ